MRVDTWNISGPGFHFGRRGLEQEESATSFTSDSLFSALTVRCATLGGESNVKTWMSYFLKDPPALVLSSTFPRAGEVRLFPTPLRTVRAQSNAGSENYKLLKKVKYVSQEGFTSLLAGESLQKLLEKSVVFQDGQVLVTRNELPELPNTLRDGLSPIWKIEQRPRVTIDRIHFKSTLYFTGRTTFSDGCGLWFGVRWVDEPDGLDQQLASLLKELADAGLGGDRSGGFGAATIEPGGTLDLPDPTGTCWVSLSRYLPHPEDQVALLDQRAAYAVENVGGWIDLPVKPAERRRNVNMLVEGSVFGPVNRAVPGMVADVQPVYGQKQPLGHPVWRNGCALAAGFTTAS